LLIHSLLDKFLDPITVTSGGSYGDTTPPTVVPASGSATFFAFLDDSGALANIIPQKRGSYATVPGLTVSGSATATVGSIGPLTGTYPSLRIVFPATAILCGELQ